jgi:hypothetical protein
MKKFLIVVFLCLFSSSSLAQKPDIIHVGSEQMLNNAVYIMGNKNPLEKLRYVVREYFTPIKGILVVSSKKFPKGVSQNQGLFYEFFVTNQQDGRGTLMIRKGSTTIVPAVEIRIPSKIGDNATSFAKLLDK